MTRRRLSPLAIRLLERFVADSSAMAGDLLEEFNRRKSSGWLWWQVLATIAIRAVERSGEIRPLQLVDVQPADALERSRRAALCFRPVNLNASPLSGVGGLGLAILAAYLTLAVPGLWWVLLGSTLSGIALGLALIARHSKQQTSIHLHIVDR